MDNNPLVEFCIRHILKPLAKHRHVSITVAILVSSLYLFNDRVLKPPKHLRHIPYHSYFQLFRSIFAKETYWHRSYRLTLPQIDSPESNGIYLRPGRTGWEIHIANPEDAKRVLLKHDILPKIDVRTGTEGSLNTKLNGGPNILFLNGTLWKEQRKVINPAFRRSMPVRLFGNLTLDLFSMIENNGGTDVEVTDLMARWTLDAIGKAGFDFNFKATLEPDNDWINIYKRIMAGSQDPLYFIFPFLDQQLLWLSPKRRSIHQDLNRFLGMIDDVIQARRDGISGGHWQNKNLEENEKDLLSLMIEAENRGEGILSNEELKSNILLFFLAGHETTSNALSFVFYFLAAHPDIQQKAREEAERILGNDAIDVLPTLEQTKQMTYINQIIKETLRITTPLVGVVPRVATEDLVLSGTLIPKGSGVTIDIFNIQHSSKIWRNADKFDPDRFADDGEAYHLVNEGMNWLPFGGGSRQCIGMNFSLAEQRVLISMMVRKFEWKLPEDSIHKRGAIHKYSMFMIRPKALHMEFKKRY